jgi:hypothetical protein
MCWKELKAKEKDRVFIFVVHKVIKDDKWPAW